MDRDQIQSRSLKDKESKLINFLMTLKHSLKLSSKAYIVKLIFDLLMNLKKKKQFSNLFDSLPLVNNMKLASFFLSLPTLSKLLRLGFNYLNLNCIFPTKSLSIFLSSFISIQILGSSSSLNLIIMSIFVRLGIQYFKALYYRNNSSSDTNKIYYVGMLIFCMSLWFIVYMGNPSFKPIFTTSRQVFSILPSEILETDRLIQLVGLGKRD